jgi:hypothetical protein
VGYTLGAYQLGGCSALICRLNGGIALPNYSGTDPPASSMAGLILGTRRRRGKHEHLGLRRPG